MRILDFLTRGTLVEILGTPFAKSVQLEDGQMRTEIRLNVSKTNILRPANREDDALTSYYDQEDADDFVGIDSSSDLDLTGVEIEGGGPDEEEEEDEDDGSESGSEENVSNKPKKDRAKNTNPFLLKLQKMDPEIILQGKDGRSNIYSRSCQSIRQPVVLTAEEKARIDRKSPGSYTKAMKFGSTPENEHYYICPRYWCSKTNTSVKDPSEWEAEYLPEFKNPNNDIDLIF